VGLIDKTDRKAVKRRIAQITREGTRLARKSYASGVDEAELIAIRDRLESLDRERTHLFDLRLD
jgi:hypothetical protein